MIRNGMMTVDPFRTGVFCRMPNAERRILRPLEQFRTKQRANYYLGLSTYPILNLSISSNPRGKSLQLTEFFLDPFTLMETQLQIIPL